jgi:hypothetical protein
MKPTIYWCDFLFGSMIDLGRAINYLEQIGSRWSKSIGSWVIMSDSKLRVKLNSTRALGLFTQRLMEQAVDCTIRFNMKD